jgi:hypothetical protein
MGVEVLPHRGRHLPSAKIRWIRDNNVKIIPRELYRTVKDAEWAWHGDYSRLEFTPHRTQISDRPKPYMLGKQKCSTQLDSE